ncbi:MAG: DNA mismatch repair protein MutS [Candidatus Omnitrophica bacterium]|nr:DNA mismatch repair protein MutS [Candidatus Omnitrophota bacterium]
MENTATPMLKQYHTIKNKHKNCILLFRLGDFYEMFYDDAKEVSRTLDLVLTSRGKNAAQRIPMCGFPHHSAEGYIARLVKAGHKIAICDQVEDPATAKGIVKRDVTRIITSGTYLDENSTDSRYVVCLSPNAKGVGVSFTDPAIGTILTNEYPLKKNRLVELISRLPVYECIFPQAHEDDIKAIFQHPVLKANNIVLSPYEDWCFNLDIGKKALCEHFGVANLHGFGIEDKPAAISSTGALLEYLKQMNKQPLKHIDKISVYADDDYVFISPAAHRGLEMNTLIRTLDKTLTPLGKRKLYYWFYHPLKDPSLIRERQQAVSLLKDNSATRDELKELLNKIPDIEKNISRLSCGYTHAKDLLAIRNTLALLPSLLTITEPLQKQNPLFTLEDIPELRKKLLETVSEDVPLSKPEGKIIKDGYNAELDQLRDIQNNGHAWLKELQQREIKATGINSLKIGFNKVFGYYIEVTRAHSKNVPSHYIRKQTLVNAERYITPELKEYEEKILSAQDKIIRIEQDIVRELQQDILNNSLDLHQFCQNIATLDVIYSLSILTTSPGYVIPTITEDTRIDIKNGRHPVVEHMVTDDFVANDTVLDCDNHHCVILTGPNMAGKSTYIRQSAILVIMAQVGSYIPAESAGIGIVDKIFTRIGAHDDIAKGQSTFMVEMNETADILNNLTERSLVILDEIGRGTSTFDGLSLAWALAEHIHSTKARTLFATHFHELTALADKHTGIKNYNVAVKEWKDEIIFLHKIVEGSSDDSYGIYVAKLAGIPKDVITRAKNILTQLELKNDLKENLTGDKKSEEQITLFAQQSNKALEKIKDDLQNIDINNLTPMDALKRLQKMKELLD